ncbi:MAG: cardiolipin synthase [Ruminococcaceae bacterium]|nr:cardiolipin synthase [Oscillospiraceae bacterium]
MSDNKGMRLLKKSKKGLLRAVFSRVGLISILLIVQFGLLVLGFWEFGKFYPHYFGSSVVLTVVMLLFLFSSKLGASAKLTWTVIITLLPVFGALLYLYTASDAGHRALKRAVTSKIESTKSILEDNTETLSELEKENEGAASLAKYLNRTGCQPIYKNCEVTYFPLGEDKFKSLLSELEKAEHFIFMEYFIVEEGTMWGQVLEILARKAREGVEVRLMYDGTCEFFLLPRDYPEKLRALGIKCKVFSKITPFVSTHYNYRDHRKIVVIDGHTAFTGGVNLADEYINEKIRFGHWKDTAVMVKGEAAASFTLMFLQMWTAGERKIDTVPYLNVTASSGEHTGYVIPFGDCPLDSDKVGERVYMDIINRATRYVHIMSPYLILDEEMENTLKFAAERGMEVVLILPGIPDKKIPFALAKTHYISLLGAGVRIYEYTPGFVHAKLVSADGREGMVGTINLDYRSFYHHFECALYMYGTPCLSDIEKDFAQTLTKCREVTPKTVKKENLLVKITGFLLKFFAPLL